MRIRFLGLAVIGVLLGLACVQQQASRGPPKPPEYAMVALEKRDLPPIVVPVVIHYGGSRVWRSAEAILPVMVEVQRIYDQAAIVLRPSFVDDTLATDSLDVYFVPTVSNRDGAGVRGLSTMRPAMRGRGRETFVSDLISRNMPFAEPLRTPVPPCLRGRALRGETMEMKRREFDQGRTTAHEMGHAMSLPHVTDQSLLMMTGRQGRVLTEPEVRMARSFVLAFYPGVSIDTAARKCLRPR